MTPARHTKQTRIRTWYGRRLLQRKTVLILPTWLLPIENNFKRTVTLRDPVDVVFGCGCWHWVRATSGGRHAQHASCCRALVAAACIFPSSRQNLTCTTSSHTGRARGSNARACRCSWFRATKLRFNVADGYRRVGCSRARL